MKNPFFAFLCFLTLQACQEKSSESATQASNLALIKQYYEHFNQHDWQKMANMYTPTAAFKDPTLGKGIVPQTREQTAKKYAELAQIFPNLRDDIVSVYPSGDRHVVVEFVSRGTAADGTAFELPICTIFTIENQLITQDFTYFDNFEEPKQ